MSASKIILLIGASGSGKTTIGKEFEKSGVLPLTSFTTRPMREGEVDGVDYYFDSNLTKDVVEFTEYNGNKYGLYSHEVETKLAESKNGVYFICNLDGAKQIVNMYPDDTVVLWLRVSLESMIERMWRRGDNDTAILSRIHHALKTNELEVPYELDPYVINTDTSTLKDNVSWMLKMIGVNQ